MKSTLIIVFLVSGYVFAGVKSQTDWSGGNGVAGPVTDWGIYFYESTGINYSDYPGSIASELDAIEHLVLDDFDHGYRSYPADIDGDSDVDLVISQGGLIHEVNWLENVDGSGTTWNLTGIASGVNGASSVFAEDIDGDGDMDVIGTATIDDDVLWWENCDGTGTVWATHIIDDFFDQAASVCVADIDNDGDMDVIGGATRANHVIWWENSNGTGTSWTEHMIDNYFDGATCVNTADINGDGNTDVVGSANDAHHIAWWNNDGGSGTTWTKCIIDDSFTGAVFAYADDINSDGYIDVLGASPDDDDVTWWENTDGTGTSWVEHVVCGELDHANSAYPCDINSDGYPDIIGAATAGGEMILWWENQDGIGTSWKEHVLSTDHYFVGQPCADIDGDGFWDVIGSGYESSEGWIYWWDVMLCSEASLESSILDVQQSVEWQILDWNCTEPPGTSVAFQVRASDSSANMGPWSDTLYSPGSLLGAISSTDSLFQYKAILLAGEGFESPVLEDVSVEWTPYSGSEEESEVEVYQLCLYGPTANPTYRSPCMRFYTPFQSEVSLSVYDVTGRTVFSLIDVFSDGMHELTLNGLETGLYFAVLYSEGISRACDFMVINR